VCGPYQCKEASYCIPLFHLQQNTVKAVTEGVNRKYSHEFCLENRDEQWGVQSLV